MLTILTGPEVKERVALLRNRMALWPADVAKRVDTILAEVKARKDQALLDFTSQFDGVSLDRSQLRVSAAEIEAAHREVDLAFLKAFDLARHNVEQYHCMQAERSFMMDGGDGVFLGLRVNPIQQVGMYIPGGTAGSTPLISTAIMCAVPARVAGVKRLVATTPPGKGGRIDPHLLVAFDRLGVHEVYRVGGAQAIAALAYGTESITAVDKIVGPGNLYVALAKRAVFGTVDIDAVAGPSEVLVLADGNANAAYIASDLLAQAEHDKEAIALLVTTDRALANAVAGEIERQLPRLSRGAIIRESLSRSGAALVVEDMDTAIDAVNHIAPEHLEILTADPHAVLGRIHSAGAVFLGEHTAQALGDYVAGPNHTLPTGGTARFASPLGVWDFVKRTTVTRYDQQAVDRVADAVDVLAHLEGLDAHAASVLMRRSRPDRKPEV
jgi:histidinol dehydrogenase